jgi:hypothetical protein
MGRKDEKKRKREIKGKIKYQKGEIDRYLYKQNHKKLILMKSVFGLTPVMHAGEIFDKKK